MTRTEGLALARILGETLKWETDKGAIQGIADEIGCFVEESTKNEKRVVTFGEFGLAVLEPYRKDKS